MNEYIILPFFEKEEWIDDFFELKNELDMSELLNTCYEDIKIGILSNDRYHAIKDKIINCTVTKRNVRSDAHEFAQLVADEKISIIDAVQEIVRRNQ